MREDGDMTPSSGPPWVLNTAVDGLIAAGCYEEALALPFRFIVRGSLNGAGPAVPNHAVLSAAVGTATAAPTASKSANLTTPSHSCLRSG